MRSRSQPRAWSSFAPPSCPGAAGSVIRTGHFGVSELLRTGHAMPQGITLGLTITAAARRKNHSFSMASVGGPRGFERPTGRQIMHIFQRITARLDTTWNRTPAKSGVLRGEQRRSNERRSTTFRRVPQPSGSTMAAATGRSRQPTLAELLAAWSGCVAAVPLDAAIQRTVPKGFGSAALNVSL